jgi:hypothetical protein
MDYRDLVRVCAEYDIRHTDAPLLTLDEARCCGVCMHDERQIWIVNNMVSREKIETFVHEALHAHYHLIGERASERRVAQETNDLVKKLKI